MKYKDILVGSRALRYHGIDIRPVTEQTDLDLVTLRKPSGYQEKVDYLENAQLYNALRPYCEEIPGTTLLVPDPHTLYVLKLSHMNHNPNWMKHFSDIQKMFDIPKVRMKDVKLGYEFDNRLFRDLYHFWEKHYPLKPINLDKSPDDFFNMSSPEAHEFHHDWFKFGDEPIYRAFLQDNHEVMVDADKFFGLPEEERINSLWEESFVIAHERKIPLIAAIQKVLCDLSKGFWNFHQVLFLPETIQNLPEMQKRFNQLNNELMEFKREKNID